MGVKYTCVLSSASLNNERKGLEVELHQCSNERSSVNRSHWLVGLAEMALSSKHASKMVAFMACNVSHANVNRRNDTN